MGEAGSTIAADLASAEVEVCGFDPADPDPGAIPLAVSAAEAAHGSDAVLSLNSAAVAVDVATAVAGELSGGTLFADFNTAAPEVKREVARVVESAGGSFADVALLGPVPGHGLRTPALVSGEGADPFQRLLGGLGMPVIVVGLRPGEASACKLARSVFAKGLAAAVGESLAAAERLGCEGWLYAELERTLVEADAGLLRRLIDGSRVHAARRSEEMAAVVAMLDDLGVPPRIAAASEQWLRSLAAAGAER